MLDLRQPGQSLDFLGYTFRYDRDQYGRAAALLEPGTLAPKRWRGNGKRCGN